MATVKIPDTALRDILKWAADVVTDVVKKLAVDISTERFDTPAYRVGDEASPKDEGDRKRMKVGDTLQLKPGEEFEIVIRL